jgi:hypothetical protein
MADWTTLFVTLASLVSFFYLTAKVNSMSLVELNAYPNYLLVYAHQLIAFQAMSLCVLGVMYARHKQMLRTLYDALRGR